MNLFSRAWQGLNLSPGERSLLKFLKGSGYSLLSSGFVALSQALGSSGHVTWLYVILTASGSMGVTLFTSLEKFWTSQGDAPLAALADKLAQDVAQPVTAAPDFGAVQAATRQHLAALMPDIINAVLFEVRKFGGATASSAPVQQQPLADQATSVFSVIPPANAAVQPVTPAPIAPALSMPQIAPIDRQWSALMPQVQAPPQ